MTRRVDGRFYTGGNALSHEVVAILGTDGTIRFDPEVCSAVSVQDVSVSGRIGNVPRTLGLPDGGMFETTDHDGLETWLREQHVGSGWIHRLERSSRFVLVALVLVAFAVFVSVKWGIPALSTRIAHSLPPAVNAHIAAGTLEALDENMFEPTTLDDARQHALLEAFHGFVPEDDDAIRYDLKFRGGGWVGANAFALPNGTVVITDELVQLANNDDEVLAVLFHEMGHVAHRHSLRQVISHSGLAMVSLLIIGDVSSAGSLVLALPSVLAESAYSRELEWEADSFALDLMAKHGIDPRHFANLMERLQFCAHVTTDEQAVAQCKAGAFDDDAARDDWLRYVSSHPADQTRIDRFRAAAFPKPRRP